MLVSNLLPCSVRIVPTFASVSSAVCAVLRHSFVQLHFFDTRNNNLVRCDYASQCNVLAVRPQIRFSASSHKEPRRGFGCCVLVSVYVIERSFEHGCMPKRERHPFGRCRTTFPSYLHLLRSLCGRPLPLYPSGVFENVSLTLPSLLVPKRLRNATRNHSPEHQVPSLLFSHPRDFPALLPYIPPALYLCAARAPCLSRPRR